MKYDIIDLWPYIYIYLIKKNTKILQILWKIFLRADYSFAIRGVSFQRARKPSIPSSIRVAICIRMCSRKEYTTVGYRNTNSESRGGRFKMTDEFEIEKHERDFGGFLARIWKGTSGHVGIDSIGENIISM